MQEPRCGARVRGAGCRKQGAVHELGVRGAVQRLLLLLFDAFTNERSDLVIRDIKDGIA